MVIIQNPSLHPVVPLYIHNVVILGYIYKKLRKFKHYLNVAQKPEKTRRDKKKESIISK